MIKRRMSGTLVIAFAVLIVATGCSHKTGSVSVSSGDSVDAICGEACNAEVQCGAFSSDQESTCTSTCTQTAGSGTVSQQSADCINGCLAGACDQIIDCISGC